MRTDHLEHTPECFASHMGAWAIEPRWMREAVSAVRSGTWRAQVAPRSSEGEERRYQLLDGGVALVHLAGGLQKSRSKFGGTSTVAVRRALRQAAADDAVKSVLMLVDSPGGAVAGTHELNQDVRAVAARKPVHAHVEDLCASAALWAVSGASKITANLPAQIGSIGVYAVLWDESEAMEMAGVKVHVVSTGGLKGACTPGTEISEELLEDVQRDVDEFNTFFQQALADAGAVEGGQ